MIEPFLDPQMRFIPDRQAVMDLSTGDTFKAVYGIREEANDIRFLVVGQDGAVVVGGRCRLRNEYEPVRTKIYEIVAIYEDLAGQRSLHPHQAARHVERIARFLRHHAEGMDAIGQKIAEKPADPSRYRPEPPPHVLIDDVRVDR